MASGWVAASNWFPGHMVKATRELTQRLAKVDYVIEVRDARVPVSSAAAHLDRALRETGRQDRRIVALNKMDLISDAQRAAIVSHLGDSVRLISTRSGEGIKELMATVVNEVQRHSPRLTSRAPPLPTSVAGLPSPTTRTAWTSTAQPGMTSAASSAPSPPSVESARSMRLSGGSAPRISTGGALPLILMVVGVPNTGKSSLINALRQASPHRRERQRKSAKPAKTGSMPGVTRHLSGFQVCWAPPVYILDTPGVLAPRLDGGWLTALRLGSADLLAHARGDDEALATFVLYTLAAHHRHALACWPTAARRVEALLRDGTGCDGDGIASGAVVSGATGGTGGARADGEAAHLAPLDFRLLMERHAPTLRGCEALGSELLQAVAVDMRQLQRGVPNTSATAGRLLKLLREGSFGQVLLEPIDGRAERWLSQVRREGRRV